MLLWTILHWSIHQCWWKPSMHPGIGGQACSGIAGTLPSWSMRLSKQPELISLYINMRRLWDYKLSDYQPLQPLLMATYCSQHPQLKTDPWNEETYLKDSPLTNCSGILAFSADVELSCGCLSRCRFFSSSWGTKPLVDTTLTTRSICGVLLHVTSCMMNNPPGTDNLRKWR